MDEPLLESMRVGSAGHGIHVVRSPATGGQCVVFLHGYPDSHRVWIPLMQALSDTFQVVAFDLRGVGGSGPPAPAADYRIDRLLPDIVSVIDAVAGPDGKAHLVGHDWGSTIGWSLVTHPQFRERVLSWTSFSGPHLGIWMRWAREGILSLRLRPTAQVLGQALRSTYVLFFLARPVPELFWRLGGVRAWRLVLRAAGVPRDDSMLDETRERVSSMTLRPMALYRRNVFRPPPVPDAKGIATPTLLIVPTRDPFVSQAVYEGLERYVEDLTVERLPAGHWAQRSHPQPMERLIRRFLGSHSPSLPS